MCLPPPSPPFWNLREGLTDWDTRMLGAGCPHAHSPQRRLEVEKTVQASPDSSGYASKAPVKTVGVENGLGILGPKDPTWVSFPMFPGL